MPKKVVSPAGQRTANPQAALEISKRVEDARAIIFSTESAPVFPIDAMGEHAPLVEWASNQLQLDPALVGGTVLFGMNACTAGHFNMQVPHSPDSSKTIVLHMHTLAHSGQGKTTADSHLLGPMRSVFDQLAEVHAQLPAEERVRYRHMHRCLSDMSEAALYGELRSGPRMQMVSTSEGASFYFSNCMNRDNRPKTVASFCMLWDDGNLERTRQGTGRETVRGRRVPMHIAIQPDVIEEFLADRFMNTVGYWPRNLLFVCNKPRQRVSMSVKLDAHSAFRAYRDRCVEFAARLEPDLANGCPTLTWQEDALQAVKGYFENMEARLANDEFVDIDPWVRRASEQVQRVAATFAAFGGAKQIRLVDVNGAIRIVNYSLACWRYVKTSNKEAAFRLWKYVHESGGRAHTSDILQLGPSKTRTKETRDSAIQLLLKKGLARREGSIVVLT